MAFDGIAICDFTNELRYAKVDVGAAASRPKERFRVDRHPPIQTDNESMVRSKARNKVKCRQCVRSKARNEVECRQ